MNTVDLKKAMLALDFNTPHEKAFCCEMAARMDGEALPESAPLLVTLLAYDVASSRPSAPPILRGLPPVMAALFRMGAPTSSVGPAATPGPPRSTPQTSSARSLRPAPASAEAPDVGASPGSPSAPPPPPASRLP